jgi:spore coat protein CotH/chitodextrinase
MWNLAFAKKVTILFVLQIMLIAEILTVIGASSQSIDGKSTISFQLQVVTRTATSITLKWSDAQTTTDFGGYTVFRNGVKVSQNLQSQTFTDMQLKANTKYSYVVKVTNKKGVSVRATQVVHTSTIPLLDGIAPSSPKNLVVIQKTETTIGLRWNTSVDNVKVAGYEIYRNGAKMNVVNANQFVDQNLTENTKYTYTVRAFDESKNMSVYSTAIIVTTKAKPPTLKSTYPQVYVRGTFNNFDASTKMTLVSDYQWQIKVTFKEELNSRFKFDIYGDWRTNFGDNNNDFVAELGNAKSIPVKEGAGEYTITYHDQTNVYTITKTVVTNPEEPVDPENPPTTNDPIVMDCESYLLQAGEVDYFSATVSSAISNPSLVWSSSDSSIVSVNGSTIKAVAPGEAQVKVALADQPNVFDVCTVTVVANTKHPVYNDANLNYVFDQTALPEITIEISTEQWNQLLLNYDKNPQNEIEVMADFSFGKGGKIDKLDQIGIRLRGNTSRRRPEGIKGQLHNPKAPDWKHAHFALKFAKFNKSQRFYGMSDLNTKWFKDDAMYARELYSYDLHKRFDVWSAPFSSYAKLNIKIKEDQKIAYFGVYQMIEAINQDYLNKRFPKNVNGVAPGNLWKGTYPGQTGPADLTMNNLDKKIGIEDPDNNIFKTYDLKTNKKAIDTIAKPQLVQFIQQLSSSVANQAWLEKNINVDLLLRSLATSVALGSWDDYWILGNNYYMYFDEQAKMHWIPYDFDNTLGTSFIVKDAGKQDVLRWGSVNSSRPLLAKIMAVPAFKAKYVQYLNELIDPNRNLFDAQKSMARIKAWHQLVGPHIKNDTGEDMVIADQPASWGNASFYRLLSGDATTNFFKAKAAAIRAAQLP